jgi:hypothetical protein
MPAGARRCRWRGRRRAHQGGAPAVGASDVHTQWGAVSSLQNGCVGTASSPAANYCFVYNYYSGSNPGSCAVPSQETANNGNVMRYWYNDSLNTGFSHTATYAYDALNRLTSAAPTRVAHTSRFLRCMRSGATAAQGH